MNKFTIVYSECFTIGSHRSCMVMYDRVETDNLSKLIIDGKYDGNVHFIFEGWPKLEGEK